MDQHPPQFQVEPLPTGRIRLPQFTTAMLVVAIAVAVLLIGGVSLFVFTRAQFSDHRVSVQISGPTEVTAGDTLVYVVTYKNDNNTALTNVDLTFSYPPEFVPLHDGKPASVVQEFIHLDRVEAHSTGEQKFEAVIVGHQGNVKIARAKLDFVPERLNTRLQSTAELSSTITKMPVELNVVVPPTVLSGQSLTYIIDYRNQTQETLSNLLLKVQYPEGFTPKKAQTTWDIVSLEPGLGGRISIDGTIQGRERDVKNLSVSLQKEVITATSRFVVDFEKAEASSVVSTPLLSAVLSIGESRDAVVHIGETLQYKAVITNNTDVDLANLTATAKLKGNLFDFRTVQSEGSFDGRTSTILWNSAVVPSLRLLKAHQQVTIPFSVALKESFPVGMQSTDSFVEASFQTETFDVPHEFPVESLGAGDALTTRISTSPQFAQRLVLDDVTYGPPSPYPPRVDQPTTFTVRWFVANPSNSLAPVKITGVLLPGVSWKGVYRMGGTQVAPTYNAKTSTITWAIPEVPAGAGITTSIYELYFQVSITPSINQIGQTPVLVTNARFEGTDSITKEIINLSVPNVTTQQSIQP